MPACSSLREFDIDCTQKGLVISEAEKLILISACVFPYGLSTKGVFGYVDLWRFMVSRTAWA